MKYCVKEGKHNFTPKGFPWINEIPWIFPSGMVVCYEFSFDISCLYKDQGDTDLENDTNKLGGISLRLGSNNVDSVLIGWRSDYQNGLIEVYPYFNRNKSIIFDLDNKILLNPDEKAVAYIWRRKTIWNVLIGNKFSSLKFSRNPLLIRRVGGWFGGEDSDGNNIGGTAPQDMCFKAKFKVGCVSPNRVKK